MRRRPRMSVAAATLSCLLLSLAAVAGCSSGSAGGVSPVDRSDPAADGSAPPAAVPPLDSPSEGRGLARDLASEAAGAGPTPAATSGEAAPAAVAHAGTTPGTASAASQPTGRGYVDTRAENRLPGTPGWQAVRANQWQSIEGYADTVATEAGQPVRLYVSATGRTFRIQVLRLGWYGGVGARQVWLSAPVAGGLQAGPRTDAATRMIMAPWHVSAVLPTGGLVAGDYVAKLVGGDGAASFVPLVIREPRTSGAVLMLNSALTWLAYNPWGGANTYTALDAPSKLQGYDERSVVVSLDRPFARGYGAGGLLDEEFNLVQTAERLGLHLNYAADMDLHSHPELLSGATGVAVLGHSEYWSRPMRNALTAARDNGLNIAYFGANDMYRRVRLDATAIGPARLMVNYKDGSQDPVKTDDTTADWTRPPYREPESSLTGVQYRCAHAGGDLVVTDPQAWLFRGLGLHAGQRLPGLVGPEFDRVMPAMPTPRPIQVMAHSPVLCYGYPEYSDLAWYSAPGGAGVFAAGTLGWDQGISAADPVTRTVVTTVTERVLTAIAQPRAGAATPAVDNVTRYYTTGGRPLDDHGRPVALPPRSKNPTAG